VRRVLLWSLAVVITLMAATWATLTLHDRATFGSKLDETHLTATLHQGDRYSIGVRDRGASVGDHWTAATDPPGALDSIEQRNVPRNWRARLFGRDSDLAGGGDGTTYFVYEARRPGVATVTLDNCFQGCDWPSPETRSVTWQITVR